jgi:hypothetical protein
MNYPAGGRGSLLDGVTVSFGRVTNHTTIGMAIKIMLRHKAASPIVVADLGSLLPKTLISAPGAKLASSDTAPKHKPKSPGQPHNTTATIVAIKFVFLLFITLFSF